MDSKKDLAAFHKKARAHVDAIAKERDKLRELIAEYAEIIDDCDEAHVELEGALDTIGKFL